MSTPKFNDVSDLMHFLPDNEKQITQFLRDVVLEYLPQCEEKLSYNVPYFFLNRAVCFIWPGSVLWGKKRQYDGVRFGFTSGHLLSRDLDYFKLDHRKYVTYRDFQSIEEIDIDIMKAYLFEAKEMDQEQFMLKKGKK